MMAFPARSDFATSSSNAAWFGARVGGHDMVCSGGGGAFVRQLQQVLRGLSAGPTFDGSTVHGSDVTVDGKWGPVTQRALWRLLSMIGVDAGVLAAVAQDGGWRGSTSVLATPQLSSSSLRAGVWVAARREPGGGPTTLDDVILPADVIPPVWRVASRATGGWSCQRVNNLSSVVPSQPSQQPNLSGPSSSSMSPPAVPTELGTTGGGGSSAPWVLIGALALFVTGAVALRHAAFAAQDRRVAGASRARRKAA